MAIRIIYGDVDQCISDIEHTLQRATPSLGLIFHQEPVLTATALLQAAADAVDPKAIVRKTLVIFRNCPELLIADQDQLLLELVTSLAILRARRAGAL